MTKTIELRSDKRKPESAQHIVKFPGGNLEVSRCQDGQYWAHIYLHRGPGTGVGIIDSVLAHAELITAKYPGDVIDVIEGADKFQHLAVRIGRGTPSDKIDHSQAFTCKSLDATRNKEVTVLFPGGSISVDRRDTTHFARIEVSDGFEVVGSRVEFTWPREMLRQIDRQQHLKAMEVRFHTTPF